MSEVVGIIIFFVWSVLAAITITYTLEWFDDEPEHQ